jgi:hypothetical protein
VLSEESREEVKYDELDLEELLVDTDEELSDE